MKFAIPFTVFSSFTLIIMLPITLLVGLFKWRREKNNKPLLVFLTLAGGLAIGIAVAWGFVVLHEGWTLSLPETCYATVHSDIYGGEIEDAAEGYVLFTLFFGNVGAILAGAAGTARWLLRTRRRRLAVSN